MTDIELISLYDKFLQAKNSKGYVKIGSVIARISGIKPLTHGQDRVVTLEAKDINGQPVKKRTFKLSDLKDVQEARLLDVSL